MKDTSNNEKIDISKDQHSEISPEAEEKLDTAPEDDGVGENSTEEKEMESSDEEFREFASILKMDMNPKLKEWFVKSGYKVHVAFRKQCWFEKSRNYHPLHVAAWGGAVDIVDMLINEAKVDVNIQVGGGGNFRGWTALHFASWAGNAGAMKRFLRAKCESRHPRNVNGTNSLEFPRTKSHKIDVNATNRSGMTALHYVVKEGSLGFVPSFRFLQHVLRHCLSC